MSKKAAEVPKKDEILSTNSIIHWSELFVVRKTHARRYVPVTCGGGCQPPYKRPVVLEAVRVPGYTGYCHSCSMIKTEHLDEEIILTADSIIHWKERDLKKRTVPVTCGKCGLKRTVSAVNVVKPGYSGLCRDCSPRRLTDDLTMNDGPSGRPGTRFLYSQEDEQGRIPVIYRTCGHTRLVDKRLTSHRDRKSWPEACRDCFNNPGVLVERLLKAATGNGSGQKNGSAKKQGPVGRPREKQKVVHTKDVICKIWDTAQSVGAITYEVIASALQLENDDVGAKGVEQRLNRNGFPGKRPDVIMAVLKERGRL